MGRTDKALLALELGDLGTLGPKAFHGLRELLLLPCKLGQHVHNLLVLVLDLQAGRSSCDHD